MAETDNQNHTPPPKGNASGDSTGHPSRKSSTPANVDTIPNPPAPTNPNGNRRTDRPVAAPNGSGRGGGRGGNQQVRRGKVWQSADSRCGTAPTRPTF
nr:hypothetical protein Iba_chr14eCG7810 [Ipomoea batatas]